MDFLLAPGDPPSKRQILAQALTLFVRDGLAETSIRAIGDAAGYTNPALYRFFDSKEALALFLFERCYLLVYERVCAATATGSFRERLAGLVETWLSLTDEHLDAVLFMNETLRDFWPKASAATRRKSLLGHLDGLVRSGQREGAVSPNLDAKLCVALLVGTLGQVARQRFFGAFTHRQVLQRDLTALLDAALLRSRT